MSKALTIVISLCSLLFLLGIGIKVMAGISKTEVAEKPILAFDVVIDVDQRENLFDQLRAFAEKHSFAIRIAPTTPNTDHYLGQLWREDIKLVMVNPFEEGKYRIYFYKNDVDTVSGEILDLLASDLQFFLSDVPDLVITNRQ